jgi:peptide chain release factor 1
MYATSMGWKTEILNANETGRGGYKEISFSVTGDNVYEKLKYESGIHRVQRVPETEAKGRVQTSAVTVAVLHEMENAQVNLNMDDVRIDTFRSSGKGGQHVNKTDSAIRLTHKPTGIVVECQDERSQYKNKDKAIKVLKARLLELEQQKLADQLATNRKNQVGSGDRSEKIRTYNYPQNRVTDHRIGLTIRRLDYIMNGNLNLIIDKLCEENSGDNR